MNKRSLFPLAIILLTSAFIAQGETPVDAGLGKDLNTGYFNSALAISESKLGKEIYQQIEVRRQQCAADLKSKKDSYDQKAKNYQAKSTTLSVAAREKEEQELVRMQREFENKAKEYDDELKLSMRQGQERVYREVQDAVYTYGRGNSFDLVVDIATGQHFVINADKVAGTTSIVQAMDSSFDKATKLASADNGKASAPTA